MASERIELVVTDLDGTLWDAGERIHDRTLDALRVLDERGTPVLVATGRRLRSAVDTLARSGLALPTVVLDGSLGRDVGPGRTFHRVAFDTDVGMEVLERFTEVGLSPCVYVDLDDAEVLIGPDPSTAPAHLAQIGGWLRRTDDLAAAVLGQSVLSFAVVGREHARLVEAAGALAPYAAVTVTEDRFYGGATMTVRPPGISKWDGVVAWCADQGLDPDRVLAVGDGENDLELLGSARLACVVSDGCEGALALADHVIDPACDGGWAGILDLCG